MEHDLVLEGRVVKPDGIEDLQVGVTDGKIAELRRQGVRGTRRIRTGSSLIFPGFVDIHVHLREPGWEYKEDFRTGTMAAVHGGVTAVVDMPNNPRPSTTVEALREKVSLAGRKATIEVKFFGGVDPGDLGRLGTMKDLVAGYKVYLSKTTGSAPFPWERLAEALRLVRDTGLPASLHCEDQGTIDRLAAKLAAADRPDVYCDIRPPESEVTAVSRATEIIRGIPGLTANICHASTGASIELVEGAAAAGQELRCEATLHHLFFNRRAVLGNGRLKTNPPLRGEEDRQALLRGLSGGGVSFLVTDHAPHTGEEKDSEGLSGVPGLDDYAHIVSWLIRSAGVDPVTIARAASANPAKYAGFGQLGEVALGKQANFSVLDLSAPEKVRGEDVRSKCGWSPYEGREFPGRARWTVSRGEVLLEDFEMPD